MSIFDDLQGWITHLVQDYFQGEYVDPADSEEDEDYETVYVTQIVYDTPLRSTKYILVKEMPDFFSDAELNTVYHSKQEYIEANAKYGYIFKHQKFENADTAQKLLDYSTDWIKNNYHGGITGFDVTALDLHLMEEDGENEFSPYRAGDRIPVYYPDPDTQQENIQTLTCISAEHNLYNPEKSKFKIGIPDVTLNKVYGESSKSGGGGGGGKKDESETDTEDEQEAETEKDKLQEIIEFLREHGFSFFNKQEKGSGDGLDTPTGKDPVNPFNMNLSCDLFKSGSLETTLAEITTRLNTAFANIKNSLDVGNNAKIGNDLNVENDANVKNDLTVEQDATVKNDLTVTKTVTAKDIVADTTDGGAGSFTSLTVNGQAVTGGGMTTTVDVTIDGTRYRLQGKVLTT